MNLPGADLVEQGLDDLAAGRHTPAACLVAIGAPRLARLGVQVSGSLPVDPELALYRILQRQRDAHGQYLALIRRLESFERALERQRKK